MISEAMGKILGMAMAYGVSALGLLLAYVNYRKRVVKAERVMTGTAWAVVAAVVVVLVLGAWTVGGLAARGASEAAPAAAVTVPEPPPLEPGPPAPRREAARGGNGWSWIGILVPAAIFLFATWVTAVLHRRFSTAGPPGGLPPAASSDVPTVGRGPTGGIG